jgi:predicted short-subunit dehydrogenase-like oxidoreductase (DUF2520 family)
MIPNITIAGSGRVASHLGKRLVASGLPVHQIISRTELHARALGEAMDVSWTTEWAAIKPDTGWVIIAVRDDAIEAVAQSIAPYLPDILVTHTSGATSSDVLTRHFPHAGIFYPLQSFSPERTPEWPKIPICVDATSETLLEMLEQAARAIGCTAYRVDDAQRAQLHVAAVFANNFSNHCFAVADKILHAHGLPFNMLHPLMEETLAKALHNPPADMQTGPAVRGDMETMRRHLQLLESHPDWQQIYEAISKSIQSGR